MGHDIANESMRSSGAQAESLSLANTPSPKEMLASALKPVADRLAKLDCQLVSLLPTESSTSQKVINHVFAAGGKRIRPALYFFCSELCGYKGEHLYPIAAVAEYVHTASLLHDDVIDNSTLRRNKPTANSIWGDQASVLVGDLIYARSSELMAATGSLDIVSGFARAIRLMSEGELLQLEACFDPFADQERYFRIIYCKTAALIGTACRSAGILASVSAEVQNSLYEFGKNLGIAFQLVDDALDYLSKEDLFGKPTLADLKEGKVTLPVLLLLTQASKEECALVRNLIAKTDISRDDIATIAKLVDQYDTHDMTLEIASQYTEQAIAALSVFPDSTTKTNLVTMASRLVGRYS